MQRTIKFFREFTGPSAILRQHEKLIKWNDPSKGGSIYLAQKIDQARDALMYKKVVEGYIADRMGRSKIRWTVKKREDEKRKLPRSSKDIYI